MTPDAVAILATMILATIFVFPYPRNVVDERTRGFRSMVSFAAGLSIAYVFIDLLPEFSGAGDELLEEQAIALPFPEYVVYMAALLGFVLFYGLERLVRWTAGKVEFRGAAGAFGAGAVVGAESEGHSGPKESGPAGGEDAAEKAAEGPEYFIKLTGFAGYVALVLYLMSAGLREGSQEGLVAYVIAMSFHFLAMRHSIRFEYPVRYHWKGAWVLAGSCIVGAAIGAFVTVPAYIEAPMLGFLGGMLIMNTTVMEMPSEKEGRFGAFLTGSVVYAALLMLV